MRPVLQVLNTRRNPRRIIRTSSVHNSIKFLCPPLCTNLRFTFAFLAFSRIRELFELAECEGPFVRALWFVNAFDAGGVGDDGCAFFVVGIEAVSGGELADVTADEALWSPPWLWKNKPGVSAFRGTL